MFELQEDEVDDHDTSTIDEVSFAANLSVASCLKIPNPQQSTKQTNCKNMTNQPNAKHAKQHGESTNQTN